MMSGIDTNKVTGVILAGGQARRMQNQDKGLVHYNGKPLISYALHALTPVVGQVLISANRNVDRYAQFGCPVLTDHLENFAGPLAGILSAMHYANTPWLLVLPCDSPLVSSEHLQRLLHACAAEVDISVAFDGERLHPVFMALNTQLAPSLQTYLAAGERKLQLWLQQHRYRQVDFSDAPEAFINLNTLAEVAALEARA